MVEEAEGLHDLHFEDGKSWKPESLMFPGFSLIATTANIAVNDGTHSIDILPYLGKASSKNNEIIYFPPQYGSENERREFTDAISAMCATAGFKVETSYQKYRNTITFRCTRHRVYKSRRKVAYSKYHKKSISKPLSKEDTCRFQIYVKWDGDKKRWFLKGGTGNPQHRGHQVLKSQECETLATSPTVSCHEMGYDENKNGDLPKTTQAYSYLVPYFDELVKLAEESNQTLEVAIKEMRKSLLNVERFLKNKEDNINEEESESDRISFNVTGDPKDDLPIVFPMLPIEMQKQAHHPRPLYSPPRNKKKQKNSTFHISSEII